MRAYRGLGGNEHFDGNDQAITIEGAIRRGNFMITDVYICPSSFS
jgi:hypothetical protein